MSRDTPFPVVRPAVDPRGRNSDRATFMPYNRDTQRSPRFPEDGALVPSTAFAKDAARHRVRAHGTRFHTHTTRLPVSSESQSALGLPALHGATAFPSAEEAVTYSRFF
jgi:hypothetical protein